MNIQDIYKLVSNIAIKNNAYCLNKYSDDLHLLIQFQIRTGQSRPLLAVNNTRTTLLRNGHVHLAVDKHRFVLLQELTKEPNREGYTAPAGHCIVFETSTKKVLRRIPFKKDTNLREMAGNQQYDARTGIVYYLKGNSKRSTKGVFINLRTCDNGEFRPWNSVAKEMLSNSGVFWH